MQQFGGNGFLKTKSVQNCRTSTFPVGGASEVLPNLQPKSPNPLDRTWPLTQPQQLQHGESPNQDIPRKAKSLSSKQSLKVKPSLARSQLQATAVTKRPASLLITNQKQDQPPQNNNQPKTKKSNSSEEKREVGSAFKRRQPAKDDLQRAEMIRVKMILCSEGYLCQKFAFKAKVKNSKEICLKLIEDNDVKTGKRDYRLSWSKPKKAFSILTDLKRISRGFADAPVLERNQAILRSFTSLGKFSLKAHCISFHYRDRSLDLVFKHAEIAESLEKFINLIRTHGSL